jgi:hypothetical protein
MDSRKQKIRSKGRRKSIKRILRILYRHNRYDCTPNGCQKATDPKTSMEDNFSWIKQATSQGIGRNVRENCSYRTSIGTSRHHGSDSRIFKIGCATEDGTHS